MKTKSFAAVIFLGVAAVMLPSCSELPQEEIDAASAAVEEVRATGAELYVPESFIALQDSLNRVMAGIESEKSKMIKNYSTTKEHLSGVTEYAGEVKQETEAKKEEMKMDIQTTITEIKSLIEINRQLILKAPKGKEGTSALVAIKGEIDALETSISETSAMFESGEYLASLDKVNASKEKATSINAELSRVVEKYQANARPR